VQCGLSDLSLILVVLASQQSEPQHPLEAHLVVGLQLPPGYLLVAVRGELRAKRIEIL
jgi:hypothetical protein